MDEVVVRIRAQRRDRAARRLSGIVPAIEGGDDDA
jgi:hypothetical protein